MTLLTLLACTGGGVITLDDTGTIDTADSADTADTEDTGEPGEHLIVSGVLTLPEQLPGNGAVGTVALSHLSLQGDFLVDGLLGQGDLGELTPGEPMSWEIDVTGIPDEDYFEESEDDPGLELALFIAGAYVDRDGDGEPGGGDLFVGGSLRMLGYARGAIPPQWGIDEGWFVIVVDFESGDVQSLEGAVDEVDGFDFGGNLLPADHAELLVTAEFDRTEDWNVDLFAIGPLLDGGMAPNQPTISSAVLGAADSTVTLPGPLGPPPRDHLIDGENSMLVGYYAAVVYDDADGNGEWDWDGETVVGSSIDGDQMVIFVRPTGFGALVYPEILGWGMGWSLLGELDSEDGPVQLDWATGLTVTASE